MTATIEIGEPRLTDEDREGTTIAYRFKVTLPGEGALVDTTTEHTIVVAITGTRASIWGFDRFHDIRLAPALFEYAKPKFLERLLADQLEDVIRIPAPNEGPFPFDPDKLRDPSGISYEINIDEARLQYKLSQKTPIEFQVADT